MGKLHLGGGRVVLRDWVHADLAPYLHWQQPDQTWRESDGPYYPPPDAEQTQQRGAMIRRRIDDHDWPTPRVVLPASGPDPSPVPI